MHPGLMQEEIIDGILFEPCRKKIYRLRSCLRNCLFGIADPGVHRVGRSIGIFLYKKINGGFCFKSV